MFKFLIRTNVRKIKGFEAFIGLKFKLFLDMISTGKKPKVKSQNHGKYCWFSLLGFNF